MDAEEEDASKLSNPSTQVEDYSINKNATVTTITDLHDEVQRHTDPQCDPDSVTELSESPTTAAGRQLLGEGKEAVEGAREVIIGGGGDESRASHLFVSAVAGEDDRGLMNRRDLAVVAPLVGGGGDDEDVICKEERRAEDTEETAEVVEETVIIADIADEKDVRADIVEDKEVRVDVPEETGKKADVADETEIDAKFAEAVETNVEVVEETGMKVDMGEETEIKPDVVEETETNPYAVEDTDIKSDVAEDAETKVDMVGVEMKVEAAEEREERTEMAKEMEFADEIKEDIKDEKKETAQLGEETSIENEKTAIDVREETDKRVGMAEGLETADEAKAIEVTEEMQIAEEVGISKEAETVGETSVATASNEIEFDDVSEEPDVQGEETEVANVAGRETDLAEETEIQEGTETEADADADAEVDAEMGDMAEEAEADADVADEMEKADMADEMEMGEELEEVNKTVGGKRKRGKSSKPPGRAPSRKKSEEDVCFICFDGGELVLCDRRGCPKAYHPSCVNRDEAFFRAKGRWNCGWHLCSICEKNAYYMCYTCTFSLCKGCIKDAVILCVRGNKGFCETCMKTVMLIERNQQGNKEMDQVDFDDKSSWEYLFKDYWLDLKGRLSLSSDELAHAKNPWKGSDIHAGKQDSPDELYEATNDGGQSSDSYSGNAEVTVSKRRKMKRRSKARAKDGDSSGSVRVAGAEGAPAGENVEWASKELLELVMHMRDGDKSVLSQFDVQTLLLDYIKKYKLRDPHRRTHVICDSRLQNLFGKPRVGHFEMLKLLESHFLIKEDSQVDDLQGSVVDTEANQLEADGYSDVLVKGGKDKKRKARKKGDERGIQSNLDDYAAIDMHNINLIYLRRNLVEELLEDSETFHDKVVGSFVRIRISGSVQKQDLYRLVQVVGTSKVAEPYRVGKRMTDILLEILNLNKTEVVSIDIISNQDFTEDECKRLRQSIKCGLINRLTVGDIQEKAMALQSVRVKDWMEAEILRLSHLRDRASDLGRRKELRECVEKLQLLKTPEERQRRLEDIPEIHSDPNMDPSYESDENDGETDDKRQESYMRPRSSGFSRRVREPISPGKGGSASNDSLSGTRNYSGGNKELSRNLSNKGFSNKGDDFVGVGEIVNENLWNQTRDKESPQLNIWEKPRIASNLETRNPNSVLLSDTRAVSETSPAPGSTSVAQSAAKINESEKIWHYQDPSGKVQGPFSMVQLRKWSNTGYFPANLRIWRSAEKQEDSILLTDALAGKFNKDPPLVDSNLSQTVSYSGKPSGATLQQGMEAQVVGNSSFDQNRTAWSPHGTLGSVGQSVGDSWKLQPEPSSSTGGAAAPSLEVPKHFRDGWASETNLPSPTPSTGGHTKGKTFEKEWSPTPIKPSGSLAMTNRFSGGHGGQQSPTVLGPESGQLMHSSIPPSSTSKLSSNVDSLNISHGVSSASKPETVESHRLLVNAHQMPVTNSVVASMNTGVDMKNLGAALQTLVQPVTTQIPPVETHGWGSGLVARPEMIAPSPKPVSGSQGWGNASSQKLEPSNPVPMPAQSPAFGQAHASSFSTGNPSGVFPAPGQAGMPPSDPWRPLVPGQSNIQPPAQPNLPWGMGVTGNQSVPRQGPENQSSSWGPMPGNPSMGWGGQVPANTNMNWGAPGQAQAPGNANSGWSAPGHGQVPGNAIPSWVPPTQGPAPVNTNPGWVAPGQGPPHGIANPGWAAPTGNPGMWGSEQNNGGDRFSNQRDRNSQGGDSGYGGVRPWNRQSSFGNRGGDSSRPQFNKGTRVCKFHESGHCKKGSQCDYLHT